MLHELENAMRTKVRKKRSSIVFSAMTRFLVDLMGFVLLMLYAGRLDPTGGGPARGLQVGRELGPHPDLRSVRSRGVVFSRRYPLPSLFLICDHEMRCNVLKS